MPAPTVAPPAPSAPTLDRRRGRRGHSADPAESHVYRQDPPSSVEELQRQAHQIIQQLDAVQCDVHLTADPASIGFRQLPRGGAAVTGSLDRLALREIKNNKNDVKFRSTNALPTFGNHKVKTADADKNNLIKAESLRRHGASHTAVKKPEAYVKPLKTGSYQHLNNINLLQTQQKGRGTLHRRGSGVASADEGLDDKYIIEKSFRQTYDASQELSNPMKRLSAERSFPPKLTDSSCQTPAGFNGDDDIVYTQVMHAPRFASSPDPVKHHPGLNYLSNKDAELIERAQTVQDRSRYIIQKIARERSRSPSHKWSSQKVIGSLSPPPPVLPRAEPSSASHVQQTRNGSSIILIGAEPKRRPPPPPPKPQYPAHVHYSVPRSFNDSNVIRLSVSGSHSSSAGEKSPTADGRRRSMSHEPTPPPPLRSGHRSKSSSPDRYFYGMANGDSSPKPQRAQLNVIPPPRRRRAPPPPRQVSNERRLPVTPQRQVTARRNGDLTADKTQNLPAAERFVEPSYDSPEKKKKIKIKFIYDDTKDEPSDVRLSKYTEYRGSDGATSSSPDLPDRDVSSAELHHPHPAHAPVQIDIEDGARLRQEKSRQQRDQFLQQLLAAERPSSDERRERLRGSPDRHSYDKDLHGVWSSLDEEDQVATRQQPSTRHINNNLHQNTDRHHSPATGDARTRRRIRPLRQPSPSPDRAAADAAAPKKKSWISTTLSRLDFKTRRPAEARTGRQERGATGAGRPIARAASHNQVDRRPVLRRQATSHDAHALRSAGRDSRSGSREPPSRRPVGRTPSFSQRYNAGELSDASAGSHGTRGGTPRRPRSLSSSLGSSQPDRARSSSGAAGSAGSTSSRSVFLHATTVADIPPPDPLATTAPPPRQRKKVGRSFSLVAPFRPKRREKEIVYENHTSTEASNGRPPRPPAPSARRGSKDSLDKRPARARAPVARSVSMPKDARPAGFMARRQVAAR